MQGIFSFLDPSSEAQKGPCGSKGIRALLLMGKREIGEGTRALLLRFGKAQRAWGNRNIAAEQRHLVGKEMGTLLLRVGEARKDVWSRQSNFKASSTHNNPLFKKWDYFNWYRKKSSIFMGGYVVFQHLYRSWDVCIEAILSISFKHVHSFLDETS